MKRQKKELEYKNRDMKDTIKDTIEWLKEKKIYIKRHLVKDKELLFERSSSLLNQCILLNNRGNKIFNCIS